MSVLQNRPTRAALAATILLALIAAMLLFMPRAQAQSMTPGPIPEGRSINVSEDEFAVAWMPAQRATYYKVEYRRHDEQFVDNGEIIVSNKESLDLYAYVGSGNADTNYYVRITPQRDDAADGPAHIQRVRTMASGERNPWDEFTFQNATLSELFPCNGGVLPLRRDKIYKSSSSIRKYVENCIIDIGTQTQGTFRSDHYFGSELLLDVHDGLNDIRRDVWFDGKTVQFQHPLTVMSIRASGVIHTYAVSRGMQASIGGQSINLLRCIRGPSDNTKRSECTVDIAGTSTTLVITPAGTGSITVDVNDTDVGGDVSGSLASGLTLTPPAERGRRHHHDRHAFHDGRRRKVCLQDQDQTATRRQRARPSDGPRQYRCHR